MESATLKGDSVEVIGVGIDAVKLTRQLRKGMSYAELVSVAEIKEETIPASPAAAKAPEGVPSVPVLYYPPYGYNNYPYPAYPVTSNTDPSCIIM